MIVRGVRVARRFKTRELTAGGSVQTQWSGRNHRGTAVRAGRHDVVVLGDTAVSRPEFGSHMNECQRAAHQSVFVSGIQASRERVAFGFLSQHPAFALGGIRRRQHAPGDRPGQHF